jgi:predicted nucleic acid-binding protein
LAGATQEEEKLFEALLDKFSSLPVDTAVAKITASYRKKYLAKGYKIKLPDCLIAATCKLYKATLITFNQKDFPMKDIKVVSY